MPPGSPASPAPEVALELAGDRVAARLGQVRRVLGLLQGPHVVGDLGVLLGELVHAALPGARLLGQVGQRQRSRPGRPRRRAAAPAWPSGSAAAPRSAGPAPTARRPGCPRRRRCAAARRRSRSGPCSPPGRRRPRCRAWSSTSRRDTGTGRVCGESASSAPSRIISSTPRVSRPLHQLVAERPPAHVRLDAVHQDHVAGQPGGRYRYRRPGAGERHPGRRPDQSLGLPALDLDHRPVDLEIVEVLGVDGADRGGLPGDAQVVDHPAGRLARVVPALERGDGDRGGELRRCR